MNISRTVLIALATFAFLAIALYSYEYVDDSAPANSPLNRGLSTDPESLDPHKMRSVQAGEVLRDIGEGLAGYTATGELIPAAADGWTISDDGLTYTFNIRSDARWSNADAVTASHFVFSLRRLVDPATAAFNAHLIADIENASAISSGEMEPSALAVEEKDDQTLIIRLSRPTPYFLALLTYPSTFPVNPDSLVEHGDSFTRPGNLVSNGAYKLDSLQPGTLLGLSRH